MLRRSAVARATSDGSAARSTRLAAAAAKKNAARLRPLRRTDRRKRGIKLYDFDEEETDETNETEETERRRRRRRRVDE